MDAFKNIGIKEFFKRYGYKYGFIRALFLMCPLHRVKDYENRKILYYYKARKNLEKNYIKWANIAPDNLICKSDVLENTIWMYWNQGIEKAPDVVKACVESIKSNVNENVIIISDENIKEYVIFPDFINERLKRGEISTAAYSDLLRFSLLESYGGTWIDSTVYLTDKLPEYSINCDFFAYRDSFGLIDNPTHMSVWFIHASKGNEIVRQCRNMSFEYWRHNNHPIDYLLSNLILTIVLDNHPEIFEKIPYATSDYSYQLFCSLAERFDEKKYKHMKQMCSVHKLSYKIRDSVKRDTNNYYSHIVKGIL